MSLGQRGDQHVGDQSSVWAEPLWNSDAHAIILTIVGKMSYSGFWISQSNQELPS